jgi:hypothetical protein
MEGLKIGSNITDGGPSSRWIQSNKNKKVHLAVGLRGQFHHSAKMLQRHNFNFCKELKSEGIAQGVVSPWLFRPKGIR